MRGDTVLIITGVVLGAALLSVTWYSIESALAVRAERKRQR